jgi:ubiquinone/menaquinone biosynthesis C-methylase UbiE
MNSPAEVKPYKKDGSSRKEEVEQMFDAIAHRYDFLNQILSFGVHKRWRKKLLRSFNPSLKSTGLRVLIPVVGCWMWL